MYVGDVRLPNMLHAAFVRSIHAHARIREVDVQEARGLDGVIGVWTGREIKGRISPFPESFEIHPARWLEGVKPVLQGPRPTALAQGKVHYVGEPVAIVVAEDRAQSGRCRRCRCQLTMKSCRSSPTRGVTPAGRDPWSTKDRRVTLSSASRSTRAMLTRRWALLPIVKRAFPSSPLLRRASGMPRRTRLGRAQNEHPHGLVLDADASSGTAADRRTTHLPEEGVRVIAPDIGGGFGPKVFAYPEEILVPFLALELGRPVKWIEDRSRTFHQHGARP